MRRKIELVAAIAGGAFGIAGLGIALWMPLAVTQDCTTTSGPGAVIVCSTSLDSLFDRNGWAALAWLLIPMLLFAGAGAAGWAHARTGELRWRRLLWLSTAGLGVVWVLMMSSLGPFMLPGLVLLLYTSVLARRDSAPATTVAA